jgi:hypothetical protein
VNTHPSGWPRTVHPRNNDRGDLVGFDGRGAVRPVLYSDGVWSMPAGEVTLPPAYAVISVVDINNAGLIMAIANGPSASVCTFLLTAGPGAGGMAVLTVAAAAALPAPAEVEGGGSGFGGHVAEPSDSSLSDPVFQLNSSTQKRKCKPLYYCRASGGGVFVPHSGQRSGVARRS